MRPINASIIYLVQDALIRKPDGDVDLDILTMYHNVKKLYVETYFTWHQYKMVFNPVNAKKLNNNGPSFFGLVRNSMLASVLLGITRITDPFNKHQPQICFDSILFMLRKHMPILSRELRKMRKEILGLCRPIRVMRDTSIAHVDIDALDDWIDMSHYDVKIQRRTGLTEKIEKTTIDEILDLMGELISWICRGLTGDRRLDSFGQSGYIRGGGDHLMSGLSDDGPIIKWPEQRTQPELWLDD
jgi:hypothetical protein